LTTSILFALTRSNLLRQLPDRNGIILRLTKIDELVKSLILLAPQAILGYMTRLAKLQELGLTPSNSLQFFTPDAS